MISEQEKQPIQMQSHNFFERILDQVPAIVYINEFTKEGDPTSLRNVWSNHYAHEFIGYSQEEITGMGFDFFIRTLHPDDLEIISKTVDLSFANPQEVVYKFIHRMKPLHNNEFVWLLGNGIMLELFTDGTPKMALNVSVEISSYMHTENQLASVLKEISRLKNELRLKSLTKRERELLNLITEGFTDREIGGKLNISPATAKTHRNKIIKKLGVKNTASLAVFAVECGLH
jgi:DNA-binding CsgD family transcriptional regulator